jgi:hypothetical protein
MDDRCADAAESIAKIRNHPGGGRSAHYLLFLPIEQVSLHVDRDQGDRVELRTHVVAHG